MSPELAAIVAKAYEQFKGYTIGGALYVCHCNCCMADKTERDLVSTPLRDIPAPILAEYTNSAHDYDPAFVDRELRYFLPRYLDLIAGYDPPDHMGLDICLRRLGQAGWRARWPKEEAEVELIDRFFEAFLRQSADRLDLADWPVGWRLDFRMADVLTMAITAGGDIGALLAAWDRAPDPAAAIHMAALRSNVLIQTDRTYFHSAYLDDNPHAADAIGVWLMRPEVTARIEAAFFAVSDQRLQIILSGAV